MSLLLVLHVEKRPAAAATKAVAKEKESRVWTQDEDFLLSSLLITEPPLSFPVIVTKLGNGATVAECKKRWAILSAKKPDGEAAVTGKKLLLLHFILPHMTDLDVSFRRSEWHH